ncbi:suppressor for copper-sensitivity B [Oceanospirillum multiglobuliferum]|uniref:Uncharacterized protein n=1 Tax=Oceanospirillum multiglobuliferum TaxID=64969 RepID=A0A1T4PXS1_9GAMM|nr:thioredoxin family protein [Oceanospirillum multiglobuliferum]OPX55422.1 hypothetical protein BTE48_08495 [Oceanospirillum multiglobuliferum]SJZ96312.1 suppressor for copper-sensitivity B [Oceanospirillum multiglobuliferum]
MRQLPHFSLSNALRLLSLLLICFFSLPSFALDSAWHSTAQGEARLRVAAVQALSEQTSEQTGLFRIQAGLEVKLPDGWKTYWRTPGAAGMPPKLIWPVEGAIQQTELLYPAPSRLDFQGLQLYGYQKHVIFPLIITAQANADKVLNVQLDARLLICRELCVPASFPLQVTLNPQQFSADAEAAFAIEQYRAKIPLSGAHIGLTPPRIQLNLEQKLLQIEQRLPSSMRLLDVFPELQPEPELDAPVITSLISAEADTVWRAQLPLTRRYQPNDNNLVSVTLRTSQGDYQLEAPLELTTAALPSIQTNTVIASQNLWWMLLLALVGGFILNLMPCVLPVLSIKVLHLIKHQKLSARQMRLSFLSTAAGIISSFIVLALVLISLKNSGQAIGWGIQFQQPLFISALAIVVLLFAANLWGRFEFVLPSAISNPLAGQGQSANPSSMTSSFVQGALATLLATPCSAPFLGTAIGFAFTQPTAVMLSIFTVLGIGLALPYLLLSLQPHWVHYLPKPGHWMLTLKKILALGLIATAIWLLWVLSDLIAFWGVLLLSALISLWWLGITKSKLLWLVPVAAWLLVFTIPSAELRVPTGGEVNDQIKWQAFEPEKISSLVAEGKVVFVDITARWCVTCVANKVAVINTAAVQQALTQQSVVAMQGDWTRPDQRISDFLSQHQRFGIPFNVVYGPRAPEGIILPELLTQEAVLSSLQQASSQQ